MNTQISTHFTIETEQEEDGRWIAEVLEIPGVLAYGENQQQAIAHVQALALRVIADKLEHGEMALGLTSLIFVAA
ncbi:MAG: type II toxin-antitoxin system HicB family antitoxin [Leptolyngbyaceae cyanobacterium CAN_BIN12]|nr:type II toxin-antitoxin system HicB family antitoxin [Leptolyngbyaceae cyanobacterium CAN_BIN12]